MESQYLTKKIKRKNDKNIPHYNNDDELKYYIKNKIEKQKNIFHKIEKNKNRINKPIKEEDKKNELNDNLNSEDSNDNDENIMNDEILEEDKIIIKENENFNLLRKNKKLIIILEGATLELGGTKKNLQIINCDDHYKIIKSMKKKIEEFRPDIIHQCLLNLFDSPLNKIGLLQVYIHTNKNILIKINPKMRIPRTFKRFSGLFSQLLLKNEIKVSDSNELLMKVINSNIDNIIDKKTPKILITGNGRLIDIDIYSKNLNNIRMENKNSICFIISTNPKGDIDPLIKNNDDNISLSSFNLDSNILCAKICSSFEKVWDIL